MTETTMTTKNISDPKRGIENSFKSSATVKIYKIMEVHGHKNHQAAESPAQF